MYQIPSLYHTSFWKIVVGVVGCWGYVPWVVGVMFQVAGDMFRCDGGKTKSTPSPTDLYWTVRLDWSLTTTFPYHYQY